MHGVGGNLGNGRKLVYDEGSGRLVNYIVDGGDRQDIGCVAAGAATDTETAGWVCESRG